MANSILAALKKYSIPVKDLTDEEIWQRLQDTGYKFLVSGKIEDKRYSNYLKETEWWFEALHLAIARARKGEFTGIVIIFKQMR
jgi:hypothetical protein